MKLLIIDDSNIVRGKIARALGSQGLDVVGLARNGREALELFTRTRPDVVTVDLSLPEMDGVACVRRLLDINPDARVLVVSALADKAAALEAVKAGAQGFLCKPFSEDELAEAVDELLKGAVPG